MPPFAQLVFALIIINPILIHVYLQFLDDYAACFELLNSLKILRFKPYLLVNYYVKIIILQFESDHY